MFKVIDLKGTFQLIISRKTLVACTGWFPGWNGSEYGYTVKNLLSSILPHVTQYDLDSEFFVYLLESYLQQHTHYLLHKFSSFVHSPYNMKTYDQHAIYQCSAAPWVKK